MDYEFRDNTYFAEPKSDLKDRINIEIGDSKQPDFKPQIKLMRWDNEVNFSVRLKDTDYDEAKIFIDEDKIIRDKDNTKMEFYDYPEGESVYKMVWFLKQKPLTNKVEFTIQSKGLDFFYQPPMTEEYLKEGQTADETHIYDSEGNVVAERPENVVGSYAVYHSTKGGLNDINGKEYRAGKAFHIYRPHIIDANGAETWGILKIENGIYSVEIPQEFLDKAVYPIKSNDTFGYTGIAVTQASIGANYLRGGSGIPVSSGNVTKISFYGWGFSGSVNIKGVLVQASDKNIVSNGVSDATVISDVLQWWDLNYSISPGCVSQLYYICNIANGIYSIYYDSGQPSGNYYFADATNNYLSPTNPTDGAAYNNYKVSIYATYTPSVASQIKKISGVAIASVKKISGVAIASIKKVAGVPNV